MQKEKEEVPVYISGYATVFTSI